MTQPTKFRIAKSSDFLSFDLALLPSLDVFFNETDDPSSTRMRNATAALLLGLAARFGAEILTIEISAIEDLRSHPVARRRGDGTFTSNYWVNPNASGSEENAKAILYAYRRTIGSVDKTGTTLANQQFHRLHFIHMELDATKYYQENLCSSGLAVTLRDKNFDRQSVTIHQPDADINPQGEVDLETHHENFGAELLDNLEQSAAKLPFETLHYLAVPCQRLALSSKLHGAPATKDGRYSLEPAAAIFLTFGTTTEGGPICVPSRRARGDLAVRAEYPSVKDAEAEAIDQLATELQFMLATMCQRQSASFVDHARLDEEGHRRTVEAYDAIGHVLRTFTSATRYDYMTELVADAVAADKQLSRESLIRLRGGLEIFRHVEGLGSLFRVHGWLKDLALRGRTGVELRENARKVENCFDKEAVVAWMAASVDEMSKDADKLAEVLARFFAPMAIRMGTVINIYSPGRPTPIAVTSDFLEWMDVRGTYIFPPFSHHDINSNAILLAVLTAVLEPFRNAEDHLRRHPRAAGCPIDIIVRRQNADSYEVFIGNRSFDRGPPGDVSRKSSGVRLVGQIISDIQLGKMDGTPPDADLIDVLHPSGERNLEWRKHYAWVRVTITPLALHAYVTQGI